MDSKTFARLGAVVFVAIAVTGTAIEMTREDEPAANPAVAVIAPATPDPLREGQRRCQRLGEAGASDAECLHVWAKSRDRFLGLDKSPRAIAAQAVPPAATADDPVTKQIAPAEPTSAGER